MAILKPGFTPGARGRTSKATWGRRTAYLANEHDRDKAILFGRDEEDVRPITRAECIHALGGKNADYRETIVALSENECRALEERARGDKEIAQRSAAHGIGERLAEGNPYVVALHEEANRWHLHVAVKGQERTDLYGPRGEAQKAFEDYWRSTRPRLRVTDWEAYGRAKGLQAEVRKLGVDLWCLEREQFEAVRDAKGAPAKLSMALQFQVKERALILHRHGLEKRAIEERHTSVGTLGSWEQKVELERAQIRRAGAENRLQRRDDKLRERLEGWNRADTRFTRTTDRAFAQGRERLIQSVGRTAKVAGRASAIAAKSLLQVHLPMEVRVLSRMAKASTPTVDISSSLVLSSTLVGHALSIALKAADLANTLAKVTTTHTKEIER